MEPVELDFGRHNPGVDPGLHIWGWEVPVYLFLGGVVAGLMVLPALLELRGAPPRSGAFRYAPFGAIALISLGMGALFLDLSHKLYVWRFYLALKPASPMSWGAWILLLVYPVLLLQGVGNIEEHGRRFLLQLAGPFRGAAQRLLELADRRRTAILATSVAVGTGLGVYTGLLLGTTPARLLWNSALLGPLFLTSGLSAGAAVLLLFPLVESERHAVSRFDLGALVVELALLGGYLLGLATGGAPQRIAAATLLTGPWAPPFWALVVFLGLGAPLVLEVLELQRARPFTRLAPFFVLLGGFSLRAVLVAAGQDVSFALVP